VTTYVHLAPPPGRGFTFQATFDDTAYTLNVTWNVFGQRWFITCLTANNVPIFHLPVVGSPQDGDINMLAGYFQRSTMVFRDHGANFEINP
jgi:hypothetical protein